MPNIWTHCLFGDALAEHIGFDGQLASKRLRNLYHLGCQGPDLLFFHHFLPWQKKTMTKLGGAMHERRCGPFLAAMADRARSAGTGSPLFLYVLGFMTHHVLDRTMHPYVFYRGGYRAWDHQRFEVAMDTLMVRSMRGISTWRFPAWTLIDIGPSLPEDVADMLQQTANAQYPELASGLSAEDWNQAYRDMVRGHKLFHDPHGFKRLLTFDKIGPMVYSRKTPSLDFLNEAKREWRHPSVEEESSNASIMDLWETALSVGQDILRAMIEYAKSGKDDAHDTREQLLQLVGDYSYETGKPCDAELPLKFSDSIFG